MRIRHVPVFAAIIMLALAAAAFAKKSDWKFSSLTEVEIMTPAEQVFRAECFGIMGGEATKPGRAIERRDGKIMCTQLKGATVEVVSELPTAGLDETCAAQGGMWMTDGTARCVGAPK